jgi:hypothetical protein
MGRVLTVIVVLHLFTIAVCWRRGWIKVTRVRVANRRTVLGMTISVSMMVVRRWGSMHVVWRMVWRMFGIGAIPIISSSRIGVISPVPFSKFLLGPIYSL